MPTQHAMISESSQASPSASACAAAISALDDSIPANRMRIGRFILFLPMYRAVGRDLVVSLRCRSKNVFYSTQVCKCRPCQLCCLVRCHTQSHLVLPAAMVGNSQAWLNITSNFYPVRVADMSPRQQCRPRDGFCAPAQAWLRRSGEAGRHFRG